MILLDIAFALLVPALVYAWYNNKRRRSLHNLPPGPKPLPIIGNVGDFTSTELWLPATQWAREFGDVCYMNALGLGIIFLNSTSAAVELLEKKGSIYSDKPILVMASDLCGCDKLIPFAGYGETWKRQRRYMQQTLGPRSIPAYYPLIRGETDSFIRNLVAEPVEYMRHTRRYAGGLALSVLYGYKVTTHKDRFLLLAEEGTDFLAKRVVSGSGIWPVDVFPVLRYLPGWFPGTGFKQTALQCREIFSRLVNEPFQYSKEQVLKGTQIPSFCTSVLSDESVLVKDSEEDIKWGATSMYAASADTTIATVAQFLLAMMEHPDVLRKAQAEVDAVVGNSRLPDFSDRDRLPYVECVLNETWRWGVPVPINLPRRVMEDDIYCDMHIPKGSVILANIWAMSRDEIVFPRASEFDPERYASADSVTRDKLDPRKFIFGFGRRRCAGSELVESSIWLLIVTMIATLDISKPKDANGKPIDPQVRYENSTFRIPTHFDCNIQARIDRDRLF